MKETVKILNIENITHDVLAITTENPEGLTYTPGQATEIHINKEGWREEGRPFTFTSLPEEEHLEFNIKIYHSHNGVTAQMVDLQEGDELILEDVFGAIEYKGEGLFLAGGAGVTPFISIFRQLDASGKVGNNKLLFANKTRADIIHKDYFSDLLGDNFINILSDEETGEYAHGFITREFIEKHMDSEDPYLYLCGPPPMMESVGKNIDELGIGEERIVKESFE